MLVPSSVSNNDRVLVWPSPWCVKGAPLFHVIKAYFSYCVKVQGAKACFFLKKELRAVAVPFMCLLLVNTWVTQGLARERVAVIEVTLLTYS